MYQNGLKDLAEIWNQDVLGNGAFLELKKYYSEKSDHALLIE